MIRCALISFRSLVQTGGEVNHALMLACETVAGPHCRARDDLFHGTMDYAQVYIIGEHRAGRLIVPARSEGDRHGNHLVQMMQYGMTRTEYISLLDGMIAGAPAPGLADVA